MRTSPALPSVLPAEPGRTRRRAVAVALGVALTGVLAGCSNPMDALQHVHSESFADLASAEEGWVGVETPAWIPVDAEGIRSTATDDETNAVIAVDGGTEPLGCEEGPRRSLPFDGRYGGIASGDALPETVLLCGPYEVVETDSGWLGWFTATETGQTPDDL
jgi:hypothetical protein